MLINRILGVFKLDRATFQEIEHDTTATGTAALIVLVVALLSGIGSGIGAAAVDGNFFTSFLSTALSALLGWVIWSAVTFFVGTSLFGGESDLNEMMRVIGFSYAPQILGIIPCLGLIGWIWSLVAGVIAVQEGMDFDMGKAILTVLIGWIVMIVVSIVIGMIFGTAALGLGAITGALG